MGIKILNPTGKLYTNVGNSKHDAPNPLLGQTLYSFQCHGAWSIGGKHQTTL
jgi:hypothetical protein